MAKKGILKKVGNFAKDVAAARKTSAEAKAINRTSKANLAKAKSWKPVARAAIRASALQKESEERTKREAAAQQASVQKAAISKWNAAINNSAPAAEGTGDAVGGNLGVTVIGNE